jgi:chromosomal replication initiation ATPase DnaA
MYCYPCLNHPFEHFVPPNVYKIIEKGCEYLGVKMKNVLSKLRTQNLVEARFILMHLIKYNPHFNFSLNEIAKIFNKNDHTSVIHALKKVRDFYEVEQDFKRKLEGTHYFIYGTLSYMVV